MGKISIVPLTDFTKAQMATNIEKLEGVRHGVIDLDNLNQSTQYPLATIIDIPTSSNPVESDKFLYGSDLTTGRSFIDLYDDLVDKALTQPIFSNYDFIINISMSGEDPEGATVAAGVKSTTVTIPKDPNTRLVDFSFFPFINKKGARIFTLNISEPLESSTDITFKLDLKTDELDDNSDYVVVSFAMSLLMEAYQ